MKKYIFLSLFIFLFFFNFTIDKASAAPKLEVNAEIGIGGKFKYEVPVSLKITVTNNGSDFSGDLVIDSGDSFVGSAYVYPLNIAEGETKTINVTLNSYSETYSSVGQQQVFYFYEGGIEDGKEIDYKGTKTLRTFSQDPYTIYLFTLTENSDRLSGLFRLNEFAPAGIEIFHLNDIKGYELPTDSKALHLADILLVDEVSLTDLSEEQQKALFEWVEYGGTLLVGASDQLSLSMGVFQSHLPLNLSNDRVTVSEVNLSKLINGQIDKDIEVQKATVNEGSNIILKDGNKILAASKKLGKGQIIQTTFSLGDKPLSGMAGYGDLLTKILDLPNFNTLYSSSMDSFYFPGEVGTINEIFPSFEVTIHWLIIIIIIYILIVGPILYLVLKRLDKREQAWWIIPIVAIGLSVIMFVFGAKDRMMNAQIQQTAFFKVNEDKSLEGNYINSLLTNKGGDYKFTTDENTTITAANTRYPLFESFRKLHEQSYITENANGSSLTLRDLKYWSVQSMIGKSKVKDAGNLDINIALKNNKIEGTIKNNFPFKLNEVVIWSGNKEIALGDINPNETLKIAEEIKSTALLTPTVPYNYNVMEPRKKEEILKYRLSSLKYGIAMSVQNDNLPIVMGWTDEPLVGAKMEGKSKIDAASYIVQTFKPKMQLSGEFTISNDVLTFDVVEYGNGGGRYYSENPNEWTLERGEYDLFIYIPEEVRKQTKSWKSLSLSKINKNMQNLQIWNEKKQAYEDIQNMKVASNLDQYFIDKEYFKLKFIYDGDVFQTVRLPEVELKGVAK